MLTIPRGQSVSSQNHCRLSIRLIRLDWLLRTTFSLSHPPETLCRRPTSVLIHILICFEIAHPCIQVNTDEFHPSSCIIFSHNCLRLSRIDRYGLGIWGGKEKVMDNFFTHSISSPLRDYKHFDLVLPSCLSVCL